MFKTSYGSEENFLSKWKLKSVLNLGIRSYWSSSLSIDNEKYEKYSRDSLTKRGIINILDRETKTFCHCMKPYKEEAKRMEKIGMCRNCRKGFPKLKLKSCSRCLNTQYCSNKCMKNSWPTHKQFCTPHNKTEE